MSQQGALISGLDLSAYMVKDTPRAIAFYRDVFGLEPTKVYSDDDGAEYEFADGTTFGLWTGDGVMPFQTSVGILFAVDDLAATLEAVRTHGVAVLGEYDTPLCTMAVIHDTEGNTVTLHYRKPGNR